MIVVSDIPLRETLRGFIRSNTWPENGPEVSFLIVSST